MASSKAQKKITALTDLRQTPEYAIFMESIGWKVEKNKEIYCYLKKIPLLGYFAKIQRPSSDSKKLTGIIENVIHKYRPFQIIYEPSLDSLVTPPGFKLSNSPYLPSKTIHIDLNKSGSNLLSEMGQKTRYNIKIASKNNIQIRQSNDIEAFANLWSRNVEHRRFNLFSQKQNIIKLHKAFGKKIDLLLAYRENDILAGILMPRTNDTAYYMYAASTKLGKSKHAPTILVWEALRLAKMRKCKTFDFEGIYDERFPLKSWQGFSKFKKTFGGEEIEYPGCFTKIILSIKIAK